MPPPPILDPGSLDFGHLLADRQAIADALPHRHEFALLDGVLFCDQHSGTYAGYYDVRADAWWARGHVPGRPLLPGVLMIEIAGQLASFLTSRFLGERRFVALAGVEDVKFRDTVEPPCRLVMIGKAIDLRPRRTRCLSQGFVGEKMVFEGTITGMSL